MANRGIPDQGPQAVQDSINYPAKHTSEHELGTKRIHVPLPGAVNNRPISDGTDWIDQVGIALTELLGGARGDIIRREAAAYVTYVAKTARSFLVGDGTDVISRAIETADLPSAALTKVDDTNVTLALGGTPAAALLAAASLTLGWTGQLAPGRGGTGVNNAGTFTNAINSAITGGGTLALGGHVLTVPESLIAAGRNVANTFAEDQTFEKDIIVAGEVDGTDISDYVEADLINHELALLYGTMEMLLTWAALQTFAAGIAADTIAEASADTGVTADGVLLKDGEVDGVDLSNYVDSALVNYMYAVEYP